MRLTYWRIECERDSSAYDIRTTTKREAIRRYFLDDCDQGGYADVIEKITIEYSNGFELLDCCLGEDRGAELIIERKTQKIGTYTEECS